MRQCRPFYYCFQFNGHWVLHQCARNKLKLELIRPWIVALIHCVAARAQGEIFNPSIGWHAEYANRQSRPWLESWMHFSFFAFRFVVTRKFIDFSPYFRSHPWRRFFYMEMKCMRQAMQKIERREWASSCLHVQCARARARNWNVLHGLRAATIYAFRSWLSLALTFCHFANAFQSKSFFFLPIKLNTENWTEQLQLDFVGIVNGRSSLSGSSHHHHHHHRPTD